MRRRVWCETLTFDQVVQPSLVALLRGYSVDLLLAVRPWQLGEVAEVVRRLQGAGLYVALWPMLADQDGRWASVLSRPKFVALVEDLLKAAPFLDELVLDFEPPLALMTQWKDGSPTWRQTPSPSAYRAARAAYRAAVARWSATCRVTTAVMPLVAVELTGQWLQRGLGTPVSELAVDRHSVMAYTSLFEGWSRGLIGRRRAEFLLVLCARLARARFGRRAGLSLGTVSRGAFGDEPGYRSVAELARDVGLARSAGIDELAVFDLGGIVRRAPAEAWLEALCFTEPLW